SAVKRIAASERFSSSTSCPRASSRFLSRKASETVSDQDSMYPIVIGFWASSPSALEHPARPRAARPVPTRALRRVIVMSLLDAVSYRDRRSRSESRAGPPHGSRLGAARAAHEKTDAPPSGGTPVLWSGGAAGRRPSAE